MLWNRKLTQITSVEIDLDIGNRKLGKGAGVSDAELWQDTLHDGVRGRTA